MYSTFVLYPVALLLKAIYLKRKWKTKNKVNQAVDNSRKINSTRFVLCYCQDKGSIDMHLKIQAGRQTQDYRSESGAHFVALRNKQSPIRHKIIPGGQETLIL